MLRFAKPVVSDWGLELFNAKAVRILLTIPWWSLDRLPWGAPGDPAGTEILLALVTDPSLSSGGNLRELFFYARKDCFFPVVNSTEANEALKQSSVKKRPTF